MSYLGQMTTAAHPTGQVPQWTLTDRLRKSREYAHLSQQQLADAIGISRNSVSNYESGTTSPRQIVLNAWAMATGSSLVWLQTGETPASDEDPDGGAVRHQGFEPRTRWFGASQSASGMRRMSVFTSNGWIVTDYEAA